MANSKIKNWIRKVTNKNVAYSKKFPFYSRKYRRTFKNYKAFQGFDKYQKRMWVLDKFSTRGTGNYITPTDAMALSEWKRDRESTKKIS